MAVRTIREVGDPILRKISKEVKEITPSLLQLLDDMKETMDEANGVGIAAVQVGALRRAIIVVTEEDEVLEVINPKLLEKKGSQVAKEGCLSVPGEQGHVDRPTYVKVEALNRDGEKVIHEAWDNVAVIFCHELDHLDGVLYIDKKIHQA